MAILRVGSQGPEVEKLQLKLKAAGYDPGDIDGDYGRLTQAAVLKFQEDRPDLDDDGVAGPMTQGALDAAILRKPPSVSKQLDGVPCNAATWSLYEEFVTALTRRPVRYGPGRGIWENGRYVMTYAPGRRSRSDDTRLWPNVLGKLYPALHCTSLTNVFLSWLDRRNELFTHAGNIPSLFELVTKDASVHEIPGGGRYRGFGDICVEIVPDGSGVKRTGIPKVVDARELYARRNDLPTFLVFGQSTKRSTGWLWWHHTGVFAFRDDKMYRLAADGFKGRSGYSADPVRFTEITEQNVWQYDPCAYRVYGVPTTTGSYGDPTRPIAQIDFE